MSDNLRIADVTHTGFVNIKTLLFKVRNLRPQWRRYTLFTLQYTWYLVLDAPFDFSMVSRHIKAEAGNK